jgi:hypothetical protein
MSVISNRSAIVDYNKTSKAFTGQRLATVTYKTDKVSGIKPESKCASVPVVDDSEVVSNLPAFLPFVKAMVERTQDSIIRNAHEAGKSDISHDDISISNVLEFLTAESTGGRLTKVAAIEWFDNVIADSLSLALAQKLGASEEPTDEQSEYIEKMLETFRANISALTAGNTMYDPDTCKVLMKAVSFAPEDDVIAQKFAARLDTMSRKVPKSMIDAL